MAATTTGQAGRLRRNAGPLGLLFASATSMIGSGWLFGAYHAAQDAGPWSIFSWVVGAVIIALIALCFAELATMFPRSGALVHMSHASHGPGLGRLWGWLLFLAYVPIPAVEAEAVVTYADNYAPWFLQPGSDLLTTTGFFAAAGALLIMAILNLLSIRWLLRVNNVITWWKVIVPLGTVIALLTATHHPENFTIATDSSQITGIFTALPTAGVVFSFLGFRTAIDLAGESRNPDRYMPISILGAIALATVVYIALQVAFILVLDPASIANGWGQLDFAGSSGPFAGLAVALGMSWLAIIIYADAYASPAGTGLMMLTGGTRILHANGELGAGPAWLTRLSRFGVPWTTVIIMWVVGCLFLLPFPSWHQMVGYISAITVLTYGIGPIALLCLRRNAPASRRPFRLRAGGLIAPLAFITSNWIVYWTGYSTNRFLFILLGLGFIIHAFFYHVIARRPTADFGWRHIVWLLPWFGGMWGISKLGDIGGLGILGFTTSLMAITLWSLVVMVIALKCSLSRRDTADVMRDILGEATNG